ncbi:hypothetical protein BGZ76_008956 [Entomortierella beljakovae]|nr:hypothetical protein BGZ76_008956 [Entomortierella beljakovae]
MSQAPVSIDPTRVLEFTTTVTCAEDVQSFLGLFESFLHEDQAFLANSGATPKPMLKMFIVRQPKPSRYLRGSVEKEFLSKREENMKDIVYIAIEYDQESFLSMPSVNIDIPAVENNFDEHSVFSPSWRATFPMSQLSQTAVGDNLYYDDPRTAYIGSWFEQHYSASFSTDELDPIIDEASDGARQTKKARGSESKKSSAAKGSKGQCQIWVVAFLTGYYINPEDQPDSTASVRVIPVIPPRQEQESFWTIRATDLLESKLMRDFVKSEVSQGRIGIDYKLVLGRRTIR